MRGALHKILLAFSSIALALSLAGCSEAIQEATDNLTELGIIESNDTFATDADTPNEPSSTSSQDSPGQTTTSVSVKEDGTYTGKEEVAAYLHEYGHLPSNFISKTKARKAGWNARSGNLAEVCPGKSIGGSLFYNEEGKLPDADGREWHECDINYTSGRRGGERIVWSNDGLIYYTGDHYKTFERLY